ncbi:hypothetical protein Acr_16g0001870 [Actinidia rufa]|uniref:Response regulatory domain-containing protein n=1 Tax=Actinidia rufa TaxID=165716 RepID=A0A7J0FY13_9ERIC|nr:hypothetical protein Acr_16g0001870 [Actinidia rufa]
MQWTRERALSAEVATGFKTTILTITNDRSKVRILLCDSDPESCQEVFSLLCKCSYQVTTVLAADVIHKLNIEGSCIDIILAEANVLVANGADILKYIMRNMELKRIPLIKHPINLEAEDKDDKVLQKRVQNNGKIMSRS